jgi:phosphate starvation-inducible PhoH-like protein
VSTKLTFRKGVTNLSKRRTTRKVAFDDVAEVPQHRISNKGGKRQSSNPRSSTISNNVFNFKSFVEQRKTVSITPKSEKQSEYVDYLMDPDKLVIFATGPAGTGKTWLGVLAAIKALKGGEISKIVITRPAVAVDNENHGFLPGTLTEKLLPWAVPIMEIFKEYYTIQELNRLLEEEVLELAALSMLRGRTFKNTFVVADEMQSASSNMTLMLLTRIGEGSKMVITGDLKQMDKKFVTENGLSDFFKRFKNYRGNSIVTLEFGHSDVQRHPLVSEVLKLYGEE